MSCTEFNFVRCLRLLQVYYRVRTFSATVSRRALLSCPCGSRPFRVVFNVQNLLKVYLGIKSVDVHRLVLSKQIKLVEGDATRRNHKGWDFLFCFNKG